MEIDIENIVVKSNPRTDFGDIDELTASVKAKGVMEPLLVKKLDEGKVELIAGERRLRAAKAAGLKKVKYTYFEGDDTEIEEAKLEENMHRKDLNPVEEAKAFNSYIITTKRSIDTLAQKISKPKLYIERRLELLKLPDEVMKAIADGKILIGHALVLARMNSPKEQAKVLKKIISEKWSVSYTENHMKYEDSTVQLQNAVFDKSECKGCRHNGGEQSMLFDSGNELKDLCLDKKCYMKKTRQWKQDETKKLQKEGIKVLSPASINNLKVKERVSTYDDDYKQILKNLHKEPENYAVVFGEDYSGDLEKQIYCLNPKARRPKTKGQTQQDEKTKTKNTTDKLKGKVSMFKREFLINKTQELMTPGTKETKAIALFSLLTEGTDWKDRNRREVTEKLIKSEKIGKTSYGGTEPNFAKILALDESEMDRITTSASGLWVKNLHNDLQKAADSFGVNLTEHFTITEDFLKLHTKDQLIDLAKEINLDKHLEKHGIEKWEKGKRTELIDYFLNQGFELKGKVPKLMATAR